jgi:amino acid transporter
MMRWLPSWVTLTVCMFQVYVERTLTIPELKRSFSLLGMVSFSYSIVTSWSALSGVLAIGVVSGGPPVMIWGWLCLCLLSLPVAYSMAEMCSAYGQLISLLATSANYLRYPIAGGQYSWVAILAPTRWARPMSYLCGWLVSVMQGVYRRRR